MNRRNSHSLRRFSLHREDTIDVAGHPESVDFSDPDTEDYFASSEDSENSASSYDGNCPSDVALRADSATPHSASHPQFRHQSPHLRLHPAFRVRSSSSNTTSLEVHTGKTPLNDKHAEANGEGFRTPAGLPPNGAESIKIPLLSKPGQRPSRKLSTIFRFGNYDAQPSPKLVRPAPNAQDTKRRFDHIRQSLADLNISGRLKQLAGTKRSRNDDGTDNNDTNNPRANKTPKPDIHCQTCQCRAAVDRSLSQMQQQPQPIRPIPPRARACTMAVLGSPARSESSGSVPQRNESALSVLEGRTERPRRLVPVALERSRDPGAAFTTAEMAYLRMLIRAAEEDEDEQGEELE